MDAHTETPPKEAMKSSPESAPGTSSAQSDPAAARTTAAAVPAQSRSQQRAERQAQARWQQHRANNAAEEAELWGDDLGSSEDYSSDDEAALGLNTSAPEFYDPQADEKDEAWATKLRQGRKSDAILSCPACLTTVCIDCQQHAQAEGQFRAMFVMNCRVDTAKSVKPKPAGSGKRRRSRTDDAEPAAEALADEEKYHPVLCAVCGQDMGVWSVAEQVHHFLHVVPTHA